MVEESKAQSSSPMAMCMEMMKGMTMGADGTAGCPTAAMFKGMMEKARLASWLMLPGVALIIGGVAMLIEPRILVWLTAAAAILLGIGVLVLASFLRRLGTRLRGA